MYHGHVIHVICNHIHCVYVIMSKEAHIACMLWVQGSSISIKDDGVGTDTEKKKRANVQCVIMHKVVISNSVHMQSFCNS